MRWLQNFRLILIIELGRCCRLFQNTVTCVSTVSCAARFHRYGAYHVWGFEFCTLWDCGTFLAWKIVRNIARILCWIRTLPVCFAYVICSCALLMCFAYVLCSCALLMCFADVLCWCALLMCFVSVWDPARFSKWAFCYDFVWMVENVAFFCAWFWVRGIGVLVFCEMFGHVVFDIWASS